MSNTIDLHDISTRVRRIIGDATKRSLDEVPLEASLIDTLGLDSLTTIDTMITLEEQLGVTMPDFDAPTTMGLETVGDVVEYIVSQLTGRGAR